MSEARTIDAARSERPVGPDAIRPGSARAWLQACRPATLPAALVPVAVGSACAYAAGGFRLGPALAALVGAVLIQIGTNLANDVFDAEKGADTAERLGPVRVVQSGLLPARAVRRGAALAFLGATAVGVYLVAAAGPMVIAIGVASILAGVAYTAGPLPLAYNGLGEVFVLVFFGGVAVCGTGFVEAQRVPPLAWAAALPVGALATALLAVNNLRDRFTDARAGKRTLAVRWGRTFAIGEYIACLVIAAAVPIAMVMTRALSPWGLVPLAALVLAIRPLGLVLRAEGRALNAALAGTAKLLLGYGIALAIGIAIGAR